jgi:hypothetical protein
MTTNDPAQQLQGTQEFQDLTVQGEVKAGSLNVSGQATVTALKVTGTATIQNLVVTTAKVTGDLTVGGHIISAGDAPTITAGPAVCAGATATIGGTDTAGLITLVTPAGCSANGKLATVTFNKHFGSTPRVSLTPGNALAIGAYVDSDATSTTSFDIATPNATQTSTTYKWYYQAIQ